MKKGVSNWVLFDMTASFIIYDIEHSLDMYGAGTLHRFSLRDVAKVLYDANDRFSPKAKMAVGCEMVLVPAR